MGYPFSNNHDMIRGAARIFLQEWYDSGRGPEKAYLSNQAYDPDLWEAFAVERAMAGVGIDEIYGGAGLGDLGRIVVLEELGASLCPIPFLTTCGIVTDILETAGEDTAKANLLPQIASGKLTASYCDGHDASRKAVTQVAYAANTDMIVLSRRMPDGMDYFAIASDVPGLVITPEKTIDPTRSFARVDWNRVAESDLKIIGYGSEERHEKIITQSFTGLAAECIGGAQKCLDITKEYSSQSYTNMLILIEAARTATYDATIASHEEKSEAVSIAKAYATQAFFKIAKDALHICDKNDKHVLRYFFNRAKANLTMFGVSPKKYDLFASLKNV